MTPLCNSSWYREELTDQEQRPPAMLQTQTARVSQQQCQIYVTRNHWLATASQKSWLQYPIPLPHHLHPHTHPPTPR
jgi:hypothetical protein